MLLLLPFYFRLMSTIRKLPSPRVPDISVPPTPFDVALRPQRPYGLFGTGSPARPPHSFWALRRRSCAISFSLPQKFRARWWFGPSQRNFRLRLHSLGHRGFHFFSETLQQLQSPDSSLCYLCDWQDWSSCLTLTGMGHLFDTDRNYVSGTDREEVDLSFWHWYEWCLCLTLTGTRYLSDTNRNVSGTKYLTVIGMVYLFDTDRNEVSVWHYRNVSGMKYLTVIGMRYLSNADQNEVFNTNRNEVLVLHG